MLLSNTNRILLWAHGLHILFSPVCPLYSGIDSYLDQVASIPRNCVFAKSCGRSLARVCSSLIFRGFRNSVVSFRLTAEGGATRRLRGVWPNSILCKVDPLFRKSWFRVARPVWHCVRQWWIRKPKRRVTTGMLYRAAITSEDWRWNRMYSELYMIAIRRPRDSGILILPETSTRRRKQPSEL